MADADGSADPQITFKVKTSGDGLHTITMAESATVLELKSKLATEEYENIPVERQRLIYSGRVMKNDDSLGSYKIKAGNTLHLVKSAASNHTAGAAAAAGSGAGAAAAGAGAGAAGSSAVPSGVPTNMAAGTPANNLLAGLTGARFAGHAPLPNMDIFGPDGGMNLPSEDHLTEMMANPAVAQSVNEALNNPAFIDFLLENNPALRATPHARELIQSPMFRHMLTDPEAMRMMNRMRRAMGGAGGPGAGGAFPAPGATDNTPADAPSSGAGGTDPAANPFGTGFNPFMFGLPNTAGPAGGEGNNAAANPFLSMFAPNQATGAAGSNAGAGAGAGTGAAPGDAAARSGAGENAAAANPLSFLFGGQGGASPPAGIPQMTPEMMQQAMQMFGGVGGAGGAGGFNPFMMPQAPAAPDNRPPEDVYADQLRQLNDMGFYDFDQNVAALRRSGGSVQGAIQHLLGD